VRYEFLMRTIFSIILIFTVCHRLCAQQYVYPVFHVPGTFNPAFRLEQDTAQVVFHLNSFQDYRKGKLTHYVHNAQIHEDYRHTFLNLNFINKKFLFRHGVEVGEVFRDIRFSIDTIDKKLYQNYNTGYLKYYINTRPVQNLTIGISIAFIGGYHKGYALNYYDWVYFRKYNIHILYPKYNAGFIWNYNQFSLGASLLVENDMTSSSGYALLASFKHQWKDNTLLFMNEFQSGFANFFNVSLSVKRHSFITYQYQRMRIGGHYFIDMNSLFVSVSHRKSGLQTGFGFHLKYDDRFNFWFSPILKYDLNYRCAECKEQRLLNRIARQKKRKERENYDIFYY
jgi:hypothetical protein